MASMLKEYPSAVSLGRAIAEQQVNPLELAESCLQQASDSSCIFISTMRERALKEARAAQGRAHNGRLLGPLDGVPVAWKDLFDIQGTVTTAGSKIFNNTLPVKNDAPVVKEAASSGVVSIGKTNMSELAYSGLGLNPHYGTPVNPYIMGSKRIPGGSSSGSALAVVTGSAAIGVATDTAGSVRIPAAFNGLVGFKTSSRRHNRLGVFPLSRTLDSLGPIARTVEDCATFDACMMARQTSSFIPTACDTLRMVFDIGVLKDPELEGSVRKNTEQAAEKLSSYGIEIQWRKLKSIAMVRDLINTHGWLGAAEAYTEHLFLLKSYNAELFDSRVRVRLQAASSMPVESIVTLYRDRAQLQHALEMELGGAILALPTVAHTAPLLSPLETDAELFALTNLATLRLTMIGSYLDLPTFALPTGRDAEDQYTSMQISLPTGEDDRLIQAALTVEQAITKGQQP